MGGSGVGVTNVNVVGTTVAAVVGDVSAGGYVHEATEVSAVTTNATKYRARQQVII
ncbi:hypothetical protein LBMAG38_26240 [Chloroflexota bacterium]|nr:hypothetical protein LBMAG38_26240 [Chloroflexota bacterium]